MTDRPVVAVFDLDHTITRRDTYLAFLIESLRRRPLRIFRSLHLPFAVAAYKLGLRDNTWLKKTFLAAILGGAARSEVRRWAERFAARIQASGLRKGAVPTIEAHREAGHLLVLVTASFDFYTEELGARLGFDTVVSTEAAWNDEDRLTGALRSGNCIGAGKVERLSTALDGGRDAWYVITYTDSHRDLPLLEMADHAVAVNPTDKLRATAEQRGYDVRDWDDASAAAAPDLARLSHGVRAGPP